MSQLKPSFEKPSNLECNKLLQEPEIRFAGIINSQGNLITGGFKRGLKPFVSDANRRKMFLELVLRVTTRMDFDYCLGLVRYSAAKREKVTMLSFPLGGNILLIMANPDIEIEKTAEKIMKICSA